MKNYDEQTDFQALILQRLDSLQDTVNVLYDMNKGIVDMNVAAKILNISKGTLYRLTSTNEIPHYKPRNKLIYFSIDDLIAWMKRKDQERKSNNISEEEIDEAMLRRLV